MANRTVSVALVADVGQYQSAMVKAATVTKSVGDTATTAGTKAQRGFDMAGRGAGLLAGVVGGAVVLSLKSAVDAASDAEQSIGGVQAVFKGYANSVIASSKEADRALGLSANSYRELATIIGSQMKNAGVPLEQLADKTESIIGIGADLAAQFGGSTQEAVNALSSAFRGELDPIERYGISLNQAALKAKALEMGLDVSGPTLSQNTRVMATLALITEQSADAQGAFGRESDTAAGRAQRAAAQWENLKTAVGDRLLPAWSALADVLGTKVIPFMGDVLDTGGDVVNFMKDNKEVALALAAVLAVELAGGIAAVNVQFNRMILTPVVLGLSQVLAGAGSLATFLTGGFAAAATTARTAIMGLVTAVAPLAAVAAVTYMTMSILNSGKAAKDARDEIAAMWKTVDKAEGSAKFDALTENINTLRDHMSDLKVEMETLGVTDLEFGASDAFKNFFNFNAKQEASDAIATYKLYSEALEKARDTQVEATRTATSLGNQFGLNRQQVLDLADKYDIDLTQGAQNAYIQFQRFYNTDYGPQVEERTAGVAGALDDVAQQASDAKDEIDQFKLSLDILTGAHVSMLEAEMALGAAIAQGKDAMDAMGGAVLDASGALNDQSENGRKAADVLLGIRDSGDLLIATMKQQGATEEDLLVADAGLRDSFIQTAIQMGIGKDAANALADEILGIPAERQSNITVNTDQATQAVTSLNGKIDLLAAPRYAVINFRANMPDLNGTVSGSGRMGTFGAIGGIVHAYASGGFERLTPMQGGIAQMVKPNTFRVIGDRVRDDEAYIPLNRNLARSHDILAQAANAMGYGLVNRNAAGTGFAHRTATMLNIGTASFAGADSRQFMHDLVDVLGASNSEFLKDLSGQFDKASADFLPSFTAAVADGIRGGLNASKVQANLDAGGRSVEENFKAAGRDKESVFEAEQAGVDEQARIKANYLANKGLLPYGWNVGDVNGYDMAIQAGQTRDKYGSITEIGWSGTGQAFISKEEASEIFYKQMTSREFTGPAFHGGGGSVVTDARSYPLTVQAGPSTLEIVRAVRENQQTQEFLHG